MFENASVLYQNNCTNVLNMNKMDSVSITRPKSSYNLIPPLKTHEAINKKTSSWLLEE